MEPDTAPLDKKLQLAEDCSYLRQLLTSIYDDFINKLSFGQNLCEAQPTSPKAEPTTGAVFPTAPHIILHPATEDSARASFNQGLLLIHPQRWRKFKAALKIKYDKSNPCHLVEPAIALGQALLTDEEIHAIFKDDALAGEAINQKSNLESALKSLMIEFIETQQSPELRISHGSGYTYISSMFLWLLDENHQGFFDAVMHTDNIRFEGLTESYGDQLLPRHTLEEKLTGVFINLISLYAKDIEKLTEDNADLFLLRLLLELRRVAANLVALPNIKNISLQDSPQIENRISCAKILFKSCQEEMERMLREIGKIKQLVVDKKLTNDNESRILYEANRITLKLVEKTLFKLLMTTKLFLLYLVKCEDTSSQGIYMEVITPAQNIFDDSPFIQYIRSIDQITLGNMISDCMQHLSFPKDSVQRLSDNPHELALSIKTWWSSIPNSIQATSADVPPAQFIQPASTANRVSMLFIPDKRQETSEASSSIGHTH